MIRPKHPTPSSMRTTRACSAVQHAFATTRRAQPSSPDVPLFFLFSSWDERRGSPRRTALGRQSGQVQPARQQLAIALARISSPPFLPPLHSIPGTGASIA